MREAASVTRDKKHGIATTPRVMYIMKCNNCYSQRSDRCRAVGKVASSRDREPAFSPRNAQKGYVGACSGWAPLFSGELEQFSAGHRHASTTPHLQAIPPALTRVNLYIICHPAARLFCRPAMTAIRA